MGQADPKNLLYHVISNILIQFRSIPGLICIRLVRWVDSEAPRSRLDSKLLRIARPDLKGP